MYDKDKIEQITNKIASGERLNAGDGLFLYEDMPIYELGILANTRKQKIFGSNVFFNRNMHIETSNICVNKCNFCSFYRDSACADAWEYSIDEILKNIDSKYGLGITEVHIVGSLHPQRGLDFFVDLFKEIKSRWPQLHIKAFTAVEIEHVAQISDFSIDECIEKLKIAGMDSVAGGGAEIFNEEIRKKLCPEKTTSHEWLRIHQKLHIKGIDSNCTMLYGHIETYEHRIDHMARLRDLQDETGGFNCFIPLKYKQTNNNLGINIEVSLSEDLRNYAVSRLFLDNIPHLKAYWPMTGRDTALLALHFGADDMDGTINDSTKIYSMAGSKEGNPVITKNEMKKLITKEGLNPVERDSLFNRI